MLPLLSVNEPYYTVVLYILTGLIGLCVGSFLNVVIYRVPENMSVAKPASHCPKCGYVLRWYDNIPILSYIILGGKCRKCHQPISIRYTLVEAGNMLLWLLSLYTFRDNLIYAAIAAVISSVALCITFIDLEHMIIPDRFQVIILALGILSIFVDRSCKWYSHLIGAFAAGIVFYGVSWLVSRRLGREALGGGDIKLAFVSGMLLGWERFLLMMLISSVIGSIVMVARRSKDGESKETPFGPFLAFGMMIAMLYGAPIIEWYLSLLTV